MDANTPRFDIEVTDAGGGAGAGNALSSGAQTIALTVYSNNDNPDLTTNVPLTLISGQFKTIDTAHLQASDPDSGVGNIVYVVTEAPTKGELRIDTEVLGVGGRFTQADIDAGRIDYHSTETVLDGETDRFRFEVRDATLRAFNDAGLEGADRDPDGTVTDHVFTISLSQDFFGGVPPSRRRRDARARWKSPAQPSAASRSSKRTAAPAAAIP